MKVNNWYKFFGLCCIILSSCIIPPRSFNCTPKPSAPDYSLQKYWAALPDKKDSADFQLKKYRLIEDQKNAKADMFFVAPTNYLTGRKWNVSVDDSLANIVTDTIGCKLEARVFNESCKVYVPRYRSAIFYSYFASKKNSRKATALAYEDIKNAFLYYMKLSPTKSLHNATEKIVIRSLSPKATAPFTNV